MFVTSETMPAMALAILYIRLIQCACISVIRGHKGFLQNVGNYHVGLS